MDESEGLELIFSILGYDWEYSVLETSRDLWKVNGLVPPMPGTDAEIQWRENNRAVPFDKEKAEL